MLTLLCHEDHPVKVVCPSADELSVIINEVRCEECDKVFDGESRYRMHYLKVHEKRNLDKVAKNNMRFHCPDKKCAYALNNQKYFASFKYLKQHYLKVHAEKKFSCSACNKSFSTNAANEAHKRICGMDFICQCGKIFTSSEALFTHAKRHFHNIDEKYKSKRRKLNPNEIQVFNSRITMGKNCVPSKKVVKHILPKPTSDVAVQTELIKVKKKSHRLSVQNLEKQICRQTQTCELSKIGQTTKSAETQTAKAVPRVIRFQKLGNQKKLSVDKHAFSKDDRSLIETYSSEYLLPDSPLPLRHNVILQDLWEEKSSSGTQTSPEKDVFVDMNDCDVQKATYIVSRCDPMLTEEAYAGRFSSIETQTEKAFCQSVFETDALSSHIETQTTENFTETMEPLHIYNDTYTQTCDDIFAQDLELSDIQTQTAWNDSDETTVSTQTRALRCLPGCSESNLWLTTQTNHMETQTDMLQILNGIG